MAMEQAWEGWDILDTYFRDHRYPFTKHHLDSFREFLRTHIPNTIRSYNPITMIKTATPENPPIRIQVYVGGEKGDGIYIDRPIIYDSKGEPMLLLPQEARLRSLTYQTNLFADVDIVYTKDDGSQVRRSFPRVLIAILPLMLHSDACALHGQGSIVLRQLSECPYDAGGYFIIDGKEKVLVSQESDSINRIVVSQVRGYGQDFSYRGVIRCAAESGESSLLPRTVELVVIRKDDPGAEDMVKPPHQLGYDEITGKPIMEKHPSTAKVGEENRPYQGAILASLPSVRGKFPLCILFRALGIESDREICEAIFGPLDEIAEPFLRFIRPSLAHAGSMGIFTTRQALLYLVDGVHYGSEEQLKGILGTEVFPHISDPAAKGRFLASCVQTLAKTVLGIIPPTDRDGYTFKRVDISGLLCARLFQENYNLFRKNVRNMLDHEYYYLPYKNNNALEDIVSAENLRRVFDPLMITESFQRSFKGMWGDLPYGGDPEQGIVQDLNRISYIGYLSHVRRVNLPLDRSIKITSPHRLHPQQWGRMCPFESPDGASIGYLKNLALLAQITSGTPSAPIREALAEIGYMEHSLVSSAAAASREVSRILINGDYIGVTDRPLFLLRALRLYRRNGLMNPFTSISFDYVAQELRILTDAGRPCRPLIILGPRTERTLATAKKSSWFRLVFGDLLPAERMGEDHYYFQGFISPYSLPQIANLVAPTLERVLDELEKTAGVIEYLDVDEENNGLVVMPPDAATEYHTHSEIHPATIFSVVTNNIPFANHNSAPRNTFYGSQSKQAIGVYATSFNRRFDTAAYVQHYAQRPLVTTKPAHYNANDRMPYGFNVIVAVMTYGGFNQEDSIMINRGAIDRGLFQITAYKTLTATEKAVSPHERTEFANPIALRDAGHPVVGIRHASYDLLNKDGFVAENSYVPRGREAAVIGMVHVTDTVKKVQRGVLTDNQVVTSYRDVSLRTDIKHYGRVDRVFVATKGGSDPQRTCKVRFRRVRRPELGDKAVSRSAQKGVIGMILSHEDMPFTRDGIVPDIIINPHAFPSRMTIGHLVETILAKACCMEGVIGDSTVFIPLDTDALFSSLEEQHKYQKHGNEILYNGRTGEMIRTEIFLGPTFYMRLKHMVTDKIHGAGVAPKTIMTHQPAAGRSKGGGMRLGEMERDVVLGHGLSQFTKESMMEKADKSSWTVCHYCGIITATPYICHVCGRQNLAVVQTPYAFKQLSQELETMGVQMRLSTEPFPNPLDTDLITAPPVPVQKGGSADAHEHDIEKKNDEDGDKDNKDGEDGVEEDGEDEEEEDEQDEEEENREEKDEEDDDKEDNSDMMGGAASEKKTDEDVKTMIATTMVATSLPVDEFLEPPVNEQEYVPLLDQEDIPSPSEQMLEPLPPMLQLTEPYTNPTITPEPAQLQGGGANEDQIKVIHIKDRGMPEPRGGADGLGKEDEEFFDE